jgi:hypothetical protein
MPELFGCDHGIMDSCRRHKTIALFQQKAELICNALKHDISTTAAAAAAHYPLNVGQLLDPSPGSRHQGDVISMLGRY